MLNTRLGVLDRGMEGVAAQHSAGAGWLVRKGRSLPAAATSLSGIHL
jgi:hypothetical protein